MGPGIHSPGRVVFAETEEKAAMVERLSHTCSKLNHLIIHGKTPEL